MKPHEYILHFNKKDFQTMTINVMDSDPFEHRLFTNPIFKTEIEKVDSTTLIRYITLFYDPKSPLLNRISDHVERKKAAALIAGFKNKGDEFSQEVISILYCNNRTANELIIEYLRYLKSPDWSFLCASWDAYHKILLDLTSDAETLSDKGSSKTTVDIAKTRADLNTKADEMAEKLSERTLKFISQDASPYLKEHLFDLIETEKQKIKITAERIAFAN